MRFKLSVLSLFATGVLFMNSAIAQPGAPPICAESVQGNMVSVRVREQGSAQVEVKTNAEGNVTDCRIMRTAGEQTARTSCEWVKDHWRSLERCPAH